jgi:hypothetical protein
MQRLEQVGLADAVRAGYEHDAGDECKLERRVGAVLAEGDLRDDQASLSRRGGSA